MATVRELRVERGRERGGIDGYLADDGSNGGSQRQWQAAAAAAATSRQTMDVVRAYAGV